MTNDLDLVRQFTQENSQDAFSELVRRHLDLVYSAALRQVRSAQLAEDVAQSVFATLAQDARKLRPDTILTAWLYTVARRTAIDTIRQESRRQLREQIAMEMNAMNATTDEWGQIAPLLDDAMAALDETDRTAILLRFFENKSLRDVGHALKVSDDTAQKRVSRAVERLREFFSSRKIAVGTGGIMAVISANAVQATPAGLLAVISAAALTGTAINTSTLIATTKTIAMTTIQKTIVVAALATAIGTGIYAGHQNSKFSDEIQTLQQQQAPLAAQLRELQAERDDASNQLAGLAVENAQGESNSNRMELLKLRGEAGVLREENEELAQALQKTEKAGPSFPTNVVSKDSWNFAGRDTPEDALKSGLWAKSIGNEQVMLDGAAPEMTNTIENFIKGDTGEERSQFLINQTTNLTGYQILSEIPVADNEVLLRVQFDWQANGQTGDVVAMEMMKQTDTGWKVIDEYQNDTQLLRAQGQ